MDPTVIVAAAIAAAPPTVAALAALKAANAAKQNTNGALQGPLSRIEATLAEVLTWQAKHERRHHEVCDDGLGS